MPRKSSNKAKTGSKRKARKSNYGASKAMTNRIKDVVNKQLKSVAETKYINTILANYSTLSSLSSGVDQANQRAIVNITPSIINGDEFDSRMGDRIHMLNYQIRFRVKPIQLSGTMPVGTTATTQYPTAVKYLNAHILRVNTGSSLTAGDLDYCIRRPVENWMDTRQTVQREKRKDFQIVKSFKIPIQYTHICKFNDQVIPPEYNFLSYPKFTSTVVNCKIDKKTFFNDSSSNQPVKYDYVLFMTWGDYLRDAYTSLPFPVIDYWQSWTFKDL